MSKPVSCMIFFFVAAVAVYLGLGAAARTEPEHACFSAAETRDKILLHGLFEPFHAMRNAAGRLQAEALGVKLCRRSDELVYELSLLRHDGRVIHVFIDAKTGQAIDSKNEQ
ncbi:MAG TPA: PepSY domain-containing protein [Methylocella sp.]